MTVTPGHSWPTCVYPGRERAFRQTGQGAFAFITTVCGSLPEIIEKTIGRCPQYSDPWEKTEWGTKTGIWRASQPF